MLQNLKSYQEIVTSRQAVCIGFLMQAKEKNERANPYVQEAHSLWLSLQKMNSLQEAVEKLPLPLLATAMGFSAKSQSKFKAEDLKSSITSILKEFVCQDKVSFREEILYRFLLTRGDTLGGAMRNVTGVTAQLKLTTAIVTVLHAKKMKPKIEIDSKQKGKIKAIHWNNRLIVFDRKPKFIGKNIDVIMLVNPDSATDVRNLLETQKAYLACGELKGGIGPAGADEHWKTARSAIERIRDKFEKQCPKLFFAANAIEDAMAKEIFKMLQNNQLSWAANLNCQPQIMELCDWLTSL